MLVNLYYQNIRGLDMVKLKAIETLLLNPKNPSIFIISEHWYCDHHALRTSTNFVISSPPPITPKLTGHQNGGLAVLASTELINSITLKHCNDYFITIQLMGSQITAVYLKPSLKLLEINELLHNMPHSDIILGDFNVRFGRVTRDKITWNIDRGQSIDQSLQLQGLHQVLPETGCSRNDHVYAREQIGWTYEWMSRADFNSDHGRMHLPLATRTSTDGVAPRNTKKDPLRYSFGCLREPVMQNLIISEWKLVSYPRLKELISSIFMYLNLNEKRLVRSDIQELVDNCYDTFLEELYWICDQYIPVYEPVEIKRTPDYSLKLDNTRDSAEHIRLFKRSQRAYAASKPLQSRDSSRSAMEEAYDHYKHVYAAGQNEHTDTPPLPEISCTSVLHSFLDPDEVSKTIRSYSTAKTGGPDRIDTRFLKCVNHSATFSDLVSDLFKLFWISGITPSNWNTSRIHLLLKDTLRPFADNTRPIALTNVMRRMFEKLLLRQWLTQDWANLNPYQAGFRRGWSTISHILLSDNLSRSGYPVSVFLDLKSAFDKVPHSKLLSLLERRGIPRRDLSLVFSLMMHNCQSLLSVNHETHAKPILRGQGVFQGSILSPFLFNIFIDDLATRLNSGEFPGITALLFADDIVIKAKTRQCAKVAIDACANWATDHGMLWGLAKCGIMGPKSITGQPLVPVYLDQEPIPEVDEYKYLGVPHRQQGVDWASYCRTLVNKNISLMDALYLQRKNWPYYNRLAIYRTFIRSTMEYCLGPLCTWISRQKENLKTELTTMLEKCHERALLWIFDIKSPKLLLESISGLGDFQSRVKMLQGSVARHLRTMPESNPLQQHYRRHPISTSSNFILPFCFRSLLLDEWASQPPVRNETLSWVTFCRLSWIKKNQEKPGILQNYVLNRCRRSNKMDSFLLLPLSEASRILQWRCNRSFTRGYCPVCQKQFNRAHLTRCSLISFHSSSIQEISSSEEYTRDIEVINNQLTSKTAPYSRALVYTPLDYLLNEKRYEEFLNALDILKEMIFGPAMVSIN